MRDFVRSAQRISGSDTEIANCLPALDTCLARKTARANKDQPIIPPSPVQANLHWGISCLQENTQDIRQNMRDFRSEVQSRCTDMQKRVDAHFFWPLEFTATLSAVQISFVVALIKLRSRSAIFRCARLLRDGGDRPLASQCGIHLAGVTGKFRESSRKRRGPRRHFPVDHCHFRQPP